MVTAEGWSDPSCKVIDVPIVQKLTFKLALLIIAGCGFGFDSFTWNDPPIGENGKMSVQESLRIVSETGLVATVAPKWFWKLPVGWFVPVAMVSRRRS